MVIESIFGQKPVTAVGYRSPESGQDEISAYHKLTAANTFQTIYTVTTGKRLFVHTIIVSNRSGTAKRVEVGVGGTTLFETHMAPTITNTFSFVVPMPFDSGVAVQVKTNDASFDQAVTLVGFEEQ